VPADGARAAAAVGQRFSRERQASRLLEFFDRLG
jgi:hypothetical protein